MSGNNSILIDTNIALYLLKGDKQLAGYLEGRTIYISFITELELLSFPKLSSKEEKLIHEAIKEWQIFNLTPDIKKYTIDIRKAYGLKLPDSIIAATALFGNLPIFTADKAFDKLDSVNAIIYEP